VTVVAVMVVHAVKTV